MLLAKSSSAAALGNDFSSELREAPDDFFRGFVNVDISDFLKRP
jgi:hypothetical protein